MCSMIALPSSRNCDRFVGHIVSRKRRLGTELLRDTQVPHRYLTLDRWDSAASHASMRERSAKDYEALDRARERFTETERHIGVFEEA
jgi:heme-degrading monooxygenase HmoA